MRLSHRVVTVTMTVTLYCATGQAARVLRFCKAQQSACGYRERVTVTVMVTVTDDLFKTLRGWQSSKRPDPILSIWTDTTTC